MGISGMREILTVFVSFTLSTALLGVEQREDESFEYPHSSFPPSSKKVLKLRIHFQSSLVLKSLALSLPSFLPSPSVSDVSSGEK